MSIISFQKPIIVAKNASVLQVFPLVRPKRTIVCNQESILLFLDREYQHSDIIFR